MNLKPSFSGQSTRIFVTTNDGTLLSWGPTSYTPTDVKGLPGPLLSFVSGSTHWLALTRDHKIYSWGANSKHQLGGKGLSQYDFHPTPRLLEFPREAGKIISVHAHGFASYAISETGELWVWGSNQESQLGLGEGAPKVIETPRRGPSFPSPLVDLAPGVCHVIALTRDGSLWTWGSKEEGRLGIPHEDASFIKIPHKIPVPDVVRVFAGSATSLVLTKNGALYIWGWGGYGQLGQSSGYDYYNHEPQMIFPSAVLDVACGWTHYLALLEDMTVWGWGHNDCKRITSQDVPEVSNPVPIEIPGEAGKIRGVIAGNSYSAFISEQGELYVRGLYPCSLWGEGAQGTELKKVPGLKLNVLGLWEECWRKILKWLFLGKSDRDSVFTVLPVEVFYHIVKIL